MNTEKSFTIYTIISAGCLITLASKLQNHIPFSTNEADYMVISQSLGYCIPVIFNITINEYKHGYKP